ncbi:MAG: bifunctional diaminohydroxyphosphoribosylaminopyrimidine deaminase/5-amino-6-(5-phosphoribosylamino)uracil reductase RibD [Clostridium sp.]|nr:bifunctional diaminohydroxyphosphoribosylaminopyrimidine deaminase/5-amino-6-(5-phosphoribosylamino)uracil reductase RibD [Clostridium sp.]
MDEKWMQRALDLAIKGEGTVNPNPLVGAVIVKNEKVIGEGYHKKFGEVHAEVNAFNSAKEDVTGATMYVTLEPCSHYGKNPPCADLVVKKNIKRVVIGILDPNPLVAGRGVKKLRDAGIEVTVGVLEKECKKINEIFLKYITTRKPFVLMKTAMSIDGKIATFSGESKWISNEKSRLEVQKLRNKYAAIMVGINTVIKDDPKLTCRIENGVNPIRIVVDSELRIPMESNIVNTAREVKTIIATTSKCNRVKRDELENKGVEVVIITEIEGKVNLKELIKLLGTKEIDSVLLEGGGTLNFSALKEGIVDKVQTFIAPKLIGGENAKTPIEGKGIDKLKEAYELKDLSVRVIEGDIIIEGYVKR